MSDQNGPVMLVMTRVLKQEGATIGRIGGNVTLPRPVPIKTAFATIVGILIGIVIALPFSFGNPVRAIFVGATFGGVAGAFLVTYSPWKGESMTKYLSTTAAARMRSMEVDGKRVSVAIGVCPIDRLAEGKVHLIPGAVNIPASQFDERGVRISAKNRNLDRIRSTELAAMLLGDPSGSTVSGLDLPSRADDSERKRRRIPRLRSPLSRDSEPAPFDDAGTPAPHSLAVPKRRSREQAPNDAPPWVAAARSAPPLPGHVPNPEEPRPRYQQPPAPSAPPVSAPPSAPSSRPSGGRVPSERPNGRPPWEADPT